MGLQVAVWEDERVVEPELYKTLQSLYTQTPHRQQQVTLLILVVKKRQVLEASQNVCVVQWIVSLCICSRTECQVYSLYIYLVCTRAQAPTITSKKL